MKIIILMGSPRKKDSYAVCEKIRTNVEKRMNEPVIFDYMMLREQNIEECKGCEQCLHKGEQYCPIKDEMNQIVEKMKEADGIIFVSPVYACQVSGTFKKMIDRVSYLFHRPELIAKPAITVLTTAGGSIKETKTYLKLVADGLGCHLCGQLQVISTMYFDNHWGCTIGDPKYKAKVDQQIEKASEQFVISLIERKKGNLPKPSLYDVYMFNALKSKTYSSKADYRYWQEKGWLESHYYYDTPLPLGSTIVRKIIDGMVKRIAKKMGIESPLNPAAQQK